MSRASNIEPMSHVFDETAEDEARKQEMRRKARVAVAGRARSVGDCADLLDKLGLLEEVR